MPRILRYHVLLSFFISIGFSYQSLAQTCKSTEFQAIDVSKAFESQKSLKLSEVVSDVELVKFEATADSYFANADTWTIGKKYILISDGTSRVVLFDRKGSFIRNIGRQGKGPGEFRSPMLVQMDPNERYVIIRDCVLTPRRL